MSTRALIGILNEDGSIDYSYNHFDGDPATMLPLLTEHYGTEEKIRHLLTFGQISGLEPTIEKTEFYHRDRGEDLILERAKDINDYGDSGIDYQYLFLYGNWKTVYRYGRRI